MTSGLLTEVMLGLLTGENRGTFPDFNTAEIGPLAHKSFQIIFQQQQEKGLNKYKRPLKAFDSRNTFLDVAQENIDQLQYIIKAYYEHLTFIALLLYYADEQAIALPESVMQQLERYMDLETAAAIVEEQFGSGVRY